MELHLLKLFCFCACWFLLDCPWKSKDNLITLSLRLLVLVYVISFGLEVSLKSAFLLSQLDRLTHTLECGLPISCICYIGLILLWNIYWNKCIKFVSLTLCWGDIWYINSLWMFSVDFFTISFI